MQGLQPWPHPHRPMGRQDEVWQPDHQSAPVVALEPNAHARILLRAMRLELGMAPWPLPQTTRSLGAWTMLLPWTSAKTPVPVEGRQPTCGAIGGSIQGPHGGRGLVCPSQQRSLRSMEKGKKSWQQRQAVQATVEKLSGTSGTHYQYAGIRIQK